MASDATTVSMAFVVDEDDMASNSATVRGGVSLHRRQISLHTVRMQTNATGAWIDISGAGVQNNGGYGEKASTRCGGGVPFAFGPFTTTVSNEKIKIVSTQVGSGASKLVAGGARSSIRADVHKTKRLQVRVEPPPGGGSATAYYDDTKGALPLGGWVQFVWKVVWKSAGGGATFWRRDFGDPKVIKIVDFSGTGTACAHNSHKQGIYADND